MNKRIVCMLVLAFLAVAAFAEMESVKDMKELRRHRPAHPRHHPHFDMEKFRKIGRAEHPENGRFHAPKRVMRPFEKDEVDPALKGRFFEKPYRGMDKKKLHSQWDTTLNPNTTYVTTFSYMTQFFNIPYSEGDSIAVQIVRTSEKYANKKSPVVTRCVMNNSKKGKICQNDKKGDSLSFEVSAEELKKNWFNSFEFSMFTTTYDSGVSVGLYVCVGENATLENCREPSTKECVHGVPSEVMDVCVCNKNFTGLLCNEKSTGSNTTNWSWSWTFDSDMDVLFDFFDALACIISLISFIITFIIILLSIAACCAFLRACCIQCRQRGRVVRNNNSRLPPPPAYQYHPLNVVPPPPPPPPPMPGQCYDVRTGNAIEMTTLPVARNANPIYVMPPLAPVKQVPVFVQPPPAPKN